MIYIFDVLSKEEFEGFLDKNSTHINYPTKYPCKVVLEVTEGYYGKKNDIMDFKFIYENQKHDGLSNFELCLI